MKKIWTLALLSVTSLLLVACSQDTQPKPLDLSDISYTPVVESENITVQGKTITIDNTLSLWDVLKDIALDKTQEEFDKIETTKLSELAGYTMIYSVPSLDTPVCTLQTKQIEAAATQEPWINFVIISHDTPFALARFCGANGIENIMTLSDSRRKDFAIQNGLYMNEYDLMARAIVIIDENLNVVYVDYADEVTEEVDLLNAFAYLEILKGNTAN